MTFQLRIRILFQFALRDKNFLAIKSTQTRDMTVQLRYSDVKCTSSSFIMAFVIIIAQLK